jgi:wobble nucleotide-excising tRNase
MIKKISKLKNFGIFHDFSWKTDLPEFKKFNLIYGWNRSGKTTISRVFASCEKRCSYDKDKFRQYPENGEFELITHDETIVKNTDLATNVLPVKVFNQDFIDDNISFDPSTPCNPIVYISEEDIDSKKQLEKLGLDKITLGKIYEEAKKDRSIKEEEKNTFLIGLGREIANILFDKTYNKTKVENRIDTIGIDNFSDKVLPDDDKKKYEEISKSDARKNQTVLTNYRLSFSFEEEIVDSFKKIYEVAEKLLSKKVISETIDRLRDDQSLNNWVKQGFDLHKSKNEKGNCLFCRKPLDTDFLDNLAKHFSKDYEELQNAINRLKNEISKVKAIVIAVNNDELYPDLKDNYTNKAKELNDCIDKINVWIDSVVEKLVEKYNNPLVTVASPEKPEDFLITYDQHIAEINKIIFNHNEKAKNHAFEVTSAREKLELNSIAVALSEQDYKKMGSGIKESEKKEKEALEAINMNNFEISELEKKTSNIGKAIKDINKHLKEFFGREEIKLELDGDKKGYIIRRDKQPAKNLSEGEKTAIAFSYFIVKVKEKEFDIKNSTIVIDDLALTLILFIMLTL